MMSKLLIFLLIFLLLLCLIPFYTQGKFSHDAKTIGLEYDLSIYDNLLIEVADSQEFVLSNNNASHFTGESRKLETRKWQGFVHRDINYLTNIWFDIGGISLDETTINNMKHYPTHVEFIHEGGYTESLFLPDNIDAIAYTLISPTKSQIKLKPTFAMRIDYYAGSSLGDYTISWENQTLYIKTVNSKYLALVFDTSMSFNQSPQMVDRTFDKDDLRKDGSVIENLYMPGEFSNSDLDELRVVAGIGLTKPQAKAQARVLLDNYDQLFQKKENRLRALVENYTINGQLSAFPDLSLAESSAWAKISLDKLRMKRFGEGFYAGYHWFDTYWGRDTFISYEGAILANGDWEFARQGIRTMAELQMNNSDSFYYGRVPNLLSVENSSPDYSTADGTGWFVYAILKYLQLSSDLQFAQEIFPHVELALLGELSRIDKTYGFVTHQDRETWMDAQTESVIQTPRGVSAIEIQALMYQIYQTYIFLLDYTNSSGIFSTAEIRKSKDALLTNLLQQYYNEGGGLFYDHINADGTKDPQKRPNQFLALRLLPDGFIDKDELRSLLSRNELLISDHGVRTLVPTDPEYKPTHDGGGWHHDAAYHNGDVWPWLSGSVIDLTNQAGEYSTSSKLIHILLQHVMTKNPVGGIGEVFDGDANGIGESVGALFQLWSMAEYIRSISFGITGYSINPINQTLRLRPDGMNFMNNFKVEFPNRDGISVVEFRKNTMELSVTNTGDFKNLELILPKSFNEYYIYLNDELLPFSGRIYTRDAIKILMEITTETILLRFTQEEVVGSQSSSSNLGGLSISFTGGWWFLPLCYFKRRYKSHGFLIGSL